jgi:hypothetical protein
VVVWEASYHFLQGLLLILLQLHLLHRYIHTRRPVHALLAVGLYAISLISLELFYLTPFLGLALCLYYRPSISPAITRIVFPQVALLAIYLISLKLLLNQTTGRLGNAITELPITYYLVKPPEYLFHLLGGRFLPTTWRATVYQACSSYLGAGIFFLLLAALIIYIIIRFRQFTQQGKLLSLLFIWLLLGTALVSTLWFPQRLFIIGDRYLYILLPGFSAVVVLILTRYISKHSVQKAIILALVTAQCILTVNLSNIWSTSTTLTNKLQSTLAGTTGKITILLNNPASYKGAPMIPSGADGEARLMHNLLYQPGIQDLVMDAPAMHLLSVSDGIRINIIDSQSVKVSLTNPQSFWQYGPDVARSYNTPLFSVVVEDPNCCYTIKLSLHQSAYRLLYHQSGQWHELRFTGH